MKNPRAAKAREKVCVINGGRCEINGYQLQQVVNFLGLNGYEVSGELEGSFAVIVNSCIVMRSNKRASQAALDGVLKKFKGKVILFGCLAGIRNKYGPRSGVVSIGPKELSLFNAHFRSGVPIESVPAACLAGAVFTPYQEGLKSEENYVLISQGCANRCAFCSIKNAKGAVASRPPATVLADLARMSLPAGAAVTLLADDCGSYGLDLGTDLAGLLEKVLAGFPGLRVKISSLYPGALLRMSARLAPLFATGRIVYANIPLQSGSPAVLRAMGRSYDVDKVLRCVKKIKRLSPATWLYTHIMIGFPKESKTDFLASLRASLCFDERMFIQYSETPGTASAALFPKVGPAALRERLGLAKAFLKKGYRGIIATDKQAL
jgi:tRNA A37 methylthiotransferase MiaB